MHIFEDKIGREIDIEVDLDIVAHHQGREVGRLEFEEIFGDHGFRFIKLVNVKVDEDYRRAGIASEMMRLGVGRHGHFSRPLLTPLGGSSAPADERCTPDGAALLGHCIATGILMPDFRSETSGHDKEGVSQTRLPGI